MGDENTVETVFQDGMAEVLMQSEELRQLLSRPISSLMCMKIQRDMEDILPVLFCLQPKDDIEKDLQLNCHRKTADVFFAALKFVVTKEEHPEKDNAEVERDCQAAVARIAELNLVLLVDNPEQQDDVVSTYSLYQKQVIRQRAKPCIAELVAYRNLASTLRLSSNGPDGKDVVEDGENSNSQYSTAITTILGQASTLIHPLGMWQSQLPPAEGATSPVPHLHDICKSSIHALDEQAQTLTKTVSTWLLEDRRVDDWISKSANETPCRDKLGALDGLVEELAYCGQIFHRYLTLIAENSKETILSELHPEWTWKYASLERYLISQQLKSALDLAAPVQIVLGTSIQVPSIVEDAQYLSTRALQRAASTRSSKAIGTVAHSVATTVWSTEVRGGVHHALVEEKGCRQEKKLEPKPTESDIDARAKADSTFASALLGALDDDLGEESSASQRNNTPGSAPSSGNFLGLNTIAGLGGGKLTEVGIGTSLCALNGLRFAATACTALLDFLDEMIPNEVSQSEGDNTKMTELAREELFRFSKGYNEMLKTKVNTVVRDYCGSGYDPPVYRGDRCLPVVRYYLEREDYNLASAQALNDAEDDVRLNKILTKPLDDSDFLKCLVKCDGQVLQHVCAVLASSLVDVFFACLTSADNEKKFTDWGALLLSKQVRIVQAYISRLLETRAEEEAVAVVPNWERLSQIVAVLQLEKPAGYYIYQSTSVLPRADIGRLMRLRSDFKPEVIAAVVLGLED